jgi:hypothetical protein
MSTTGDAWARFGASSVAAAIAETATLPTDVAKVRLQVQQSARGPPRFSGLADCLRKTAAEEGVAACWKGLQPALLRQVLYSSLALVLYEPIRALVGRALGGGGDAARPSFAQRLAAGGTAGALSIAVFNPTEVLKTQMQTAADATTMRAVAARVHAEGGVLAFWSGLQPNVARTFLVNAAELGTYDEAKSRLAPVVGDNALAHIGASGIAGVASACTSTPADVVKTRLMNVAGGAGDRQYAGVVDALRTIVRDEGVGALYKGFTPIVVRKVLWCSMFFVTYEQLRAALVAG